MNSCYQMVLGIKWILFCSPHLGEADVVDFEVLIYFLQCAFFGGVDFIDPEAPILFLQCTSFSGVGLFDPEALIYFLQWVTLWHLDSGLIGFLFAGNTLTSFFLFSLPSLHFHILRLVSLPWRVGWSPLPSTSSRREASRPGPNTSLTILSWSPVFARG